MINSSSSKTGKGHNLLNLFLESLISERGAAPNTVSAYRRDGEEWLEFLNGLCPTLVSPETFHRYLRHLGEKNQKSRTMARKISALRQFYGFLLIENRISTDLLETVSLPSYSTGLPKYLTQEEVFRLFERAHEDTSHQGKRLVALLELLYATGMRVSELVSFPLETLQATLEDPNTPLFIVGKGGHQRVGFLPPPTVKALQAYISVRHHFLPICKTKGTRPSPYVFPSSADKGFLTRQRVGQYLKDLAIRAELAPERVSPHVLRHAFATHLLQRGMDLVSLKQLLGHQDIATTQVYTYVAPERLSHVLETCHPLSGTLTPPSLLPPLSDPTEEA